MKSTNDKPVLYAEDSCPYVFRARIALNYSGVDVEYREVEIENMPQSLLEVSPKAEVPVLVFSDGTVIDESWDIIEWAIKQHDPENWAGDKGEALRLAEQLKMENDRDFGEPSKFYKFEEYYNRPDHLSDREDCEPFLDRLEERLSDQSFMYGERFTAADVPIYPAVNGVAKIDTEWFAARFPKVNAWLERCAEQPQVKGVKFGHSVWKPS